MPTLATLPPEALLPDLSFNFPDARLWTELVFLPSRTKTGKDDGHYSERLLELHTQFRMRGVFTRSTPGPERSEGPDSFAPAEKESGPSRRSVPVVDGRRTISHAIGARCRTTRHQPSHELQ